MRAARLLGLALLLLVGCANPGERQAEKVLVERLPEYLGPAQSYEADVKAASLGALMRGRVRSVKIQGRGVQLLPECQAAEVNVDAREVSADIKKRTLQSVGEARFTVRIEEKELDRLVRARRPKLADLRLALRGRFVSVKVTPEVFGYPTVPVQVEGGLLARNGGLFLDFEPDRARLAVVPIPKPALDFIAERINPVVDFSSLKVPIRVERAEVRGGALWLSGFLPPDALTRLGKLR